MNLDSETLETLGADTRWHDQMWRLAEARAKDPRGGSEPSIGASVAVMLSCAVDGEVLAAIDVVARRRGVTRSDIVRCGLALALHRDAEWLRGVR
jgi:hypothetical protein